jgi:hypothetical protein
MSNIIYPNGNATITIPAGEKIAIFTRDLAKVYKSVGYPNFPATNDVDFTVENTTTVSSAYASGATLTVEAFAAEVYYEVGTAPQVQEIYTSPKQGAPTAMTVAATMTATGLLSRIITGTHAAGATQAYVLPTGTLLDAASEFAIGDAFDWVLINLSAAAADTITVTAGTDHTIVGNPIVQSAHSTTGGIYGNSSQWRTRKTAANTFVSYRIA